jgi:hypothetical protein
MKMMRSTWLAGCVQIILQSLVIALISGCAIAGRPARQTPLSAPADLTPRTPTSLSDVSPTRASQFQITPAPTHAFDEPPTRTPIPTNTRPVPPTPTLMLVPLAKLTLPPKPPPTHTLTPTPAVLPAVLKGKIAFKSDRLGQEAIFVMSPNGKDVALLTNRWAYETALKQDATALNGRYEVFVRETESPRAVQIFFLDHYWKRETQITWLTKGGAAWDPAFSPRGDQIAFTSTIFLSSTLMARTNVA